MMQVKWSGTVQKGKLVQRRGLIDWWRARFTELWLQKGWQDCRRSLSHAISGHPFATLAMLTADSHPCGAVLQIVSGADLGCSSIFFFFLWNKTLLQTLNLHQLVSPAPRRGSQMSAWVWAVGSLGWHGAAGELGMCWAALVPAGCFCCQPWTRAVMLWHLGAMKPWGDLWLKVFLIWMRSLEGLLWQTHDPAKRATYMECWMEGCWLQHVSFSAVLTAISSR